MDLVVGAMGILADKLFQLLRDEYKLQKDIKVKVESLANDLKSVHVALCKVAQVPYDELDPQVKLWASEAREASYDMEDILDTFFVRVDGCQQPIGADNGKVKNLLKNMDIMSNISKFRYRREIEGIIEGIKKRVDEIAKRRDRNKVDNVAPNSDTTTSTDPRVLMNFYTKASDLVGIKEPSNKLIEMLTVGDHDASDKEMKIISVIGPGGLGKTTLTKVVYEKLTADLRIEYKVSFSVGRNPNLKKVFRDILIDLDKDRYMENTNYFMTLDEVQLIKVVRTILKDKRYFIVIDDVWDEISWKRIRAAFEDNNLGSKIIVTTRNTHVANLAHDTYKIQPLGPDTSKILFYGRIFGSQDKCPKNLCDLSDRILKKCDGVPLAIITIASMLAHKEYDIIVWQEVCDSIGPGLNNSNDMYNDMRKILSLSYYDLPSHMKTCFLYLCMYPEDSHIYRDQLIWKWISEGFIQPQKNGDDPFELGKIYFNDLISRSLIRRGYEVFPYKIVFCYVHDMILDLICFLSREENFVTISNDIDQVTCSSSTKIRRLSLKNTTWPKNDVSQVRSIAVFGASIDSMPSFSCFDMLRVLDLDGCSLKNCEGSKPYVGNLIHLRYLGLSNTGIEMPLVGIEKLQFLQVLRMDQHGSATIEVPESIFGLKKLMCLEGVLCKPRRGNLLSNLSSLQVLSRLCLDEDPEGIVEALVHLKHLTSLTVNIKLEMVGQSIFYPLMNNVHKLKRIQSLNIVDNENLITWAPFPDLTFLKFYTARTLRTLPKQISPASSPSLARLDMNVGTIEPEDIQILGTLPNLVELILRSDYEDYLEQPMKTFVVSADAFPSLRVCNFFYVVMVPSMFTSGAMLQLNVFRFDLRARDFFINDGLDFDDLAICHLPSLGLVACTIIIEEATKEEEVTKLMEAVKHAVDVHPNHPTLHLDRKIKKRRHPRG